MITDKKCSVCKEEKPVTEFYRKGVYKQSYCKSCYREAWKKRSAKQKDNQFFRHDPRIVTI